MKNKEWKKWSSIEHETWQKLTKRQLPQAEQWASSMWKKGFKVSQISASKIPDLKKIDQILQKMTKWSLVPTDLSFADGQSWFETLQRNEFLITKYIRPTNSLDYTPMPDVFHDLFGHVPFLFDEQFSRIVKKFTQAMLSVDPETRVKLGHVWWFTVEFGMILEKNKPKILGAGIISSFAESRRVIEGKVQIIPFDFDVVGSTNEHHHEFHDKVFLLESLDQLEVFINQFIS